MSQNGVLAFLTTRHHMSRSNHSSLLMTMDLLNLVTQIYPTSAMMLFCILGLAVSMNYRAIYEAVREFRRENVIEIESVESTTTQLQVWKRNHALVCDVAEELSNCFGLILLIKVGYLFISIINSAIFLMIGITDVESEAEITMYIGFSIEHVVHLFMICYVADQIRYEVSDGSLLIAISLKFLLGLGTENQPVVAQVLGDDGHSRTTDQFLDGAGVSRCTGNQRTGLLSNRPTPVPHGKFYVQFDALVEPVHLVFDRSSVRP